LFLNSLRKIYVIELAQRLGRKFLRIPYWQRQKDKKVFLMKIFVPLQIFWIA
jgi:hypothetical protein